MSNNIIKFKRGDTFTLNCTYKVNGVPSSIATIDIDSQVRDFRGSLIEELTVTKTGSTGVFTLLSSATQTSEWPISVLRCDIQFSQGGIVRSTQTIDISVLEDITQ